MSIRFNHAAGTITSTGTASIVIEGGTPTVPRPLRLNASSVIMPNKALPIGEAGAVVFDTTSTTLKYHNGISWVELLSQDDILAPVNISLTDIYTQLGERVSSVSYSSSTVPSASISGTNLNIVFPSSTSGGETAIPGLFTSSPPGSIMQYSLTSGQSVDSIREQLSGETGGNSTRTGTLANPYVTKTGWCFADGMYWTWNGETVVTKQVPNLNQNAYLKGITTSGVTKTDNVIASAGTIGNTTITLPDHYHGIGNMRGLSGDVGDDGVFIIGKTFNDGTSYSGVQITGDLQGRSTYVVNGSDSRTALTTTKPIYSSGNTSTHTHNLSNVDVAHFNVAYLYSIAEPSLALNQTAGDARYVLKAGDTMTGSLVIANSATIRADDTNLILWFRNSTNGERAAIYHNSTNNTLRLRSAGGNEVSISNTGVLTSTGLVVSGTSATVGGNNIVRTINGIAATSAGDVTLPTVGEIRMGALATMFLTGDRDQYVSAGYAFTGVRHEDSGNRISRVYSRPIQYNVNGTWYTISQV